MVAWGRYDCAWWASRSTHRPQQGLIWLKGMHQKEWLGGLFFLEGTIKSPRSPMNLPLSLLWIGFAALQNFHFFNHYIEIIFLSPRLMMAPKWGSKCRALTLLEVLILGCLLLFLARPGRLQHPTCDVFWELHMVAHLVDCCKHLGWLSPDLTDLKTKTFHEGIQMAFAEPVF